MSNSTWRPPKRRNKKAWRKIEQAKQFEVGTPEWRELMLWDKKAVDRAATRRAQRINQSMGWRKGYKLRDAEIKKGIYGMDYPPDMFYPFQVIKKGNNR